jgi:murein endopeptidase
MGVAVQREVVVCRQIAEAFAGCRAIVPALGIPPSHMDNWQVMRQASRKALLRLQIVVVLEELAEQLAGDRVVKSLLIVESVLQEALVVREEPDDLQEVVGEVEQAECRGC